MDYKKNFINNLKKYRKENNLTQDDLAEQLDYSQKNIAKWEQGLSIPTIDILIELSKLMNMSLDELLGINTKSIFDQCVDYILEMENLEPDKVLTLWDRDEIIRTTEKELIENKVGTLYFILTTLIVETKSLRVDINDINKMYGSSIKPTTRKENILDFLKQNNYIAEDSEFLIISKSFAIEMLDNEEIKLLKEQKKTSDNVLSLKKSINISNCSQDEIDFYNINTLHLNSLKCELENLQTLKKLLFKD